MIYCNKIGFKLLIIIALVDIITRSTNIVIVCFTLKNICETNPNICGSNTISFLCGIQLGHNSSKTERSKNLAFEKRNEWSFQNFPSEYSKGASKKTNEPHHQHHIEKYYGRYS